MDLVYSPVSTLAMAPQDPLARHAQLLHDTLGLRVGRVGPRIDFREAILPECPAYYRLCCLGHQPLAPVFPGYPIADRGNLILLVDCHSNAAHALSAQYDGEFWLRLP